MSHKLVRYLDETKPITLTFKNADGTARDITGATIEWRFGSTDGSQLLTIAATITDAPNGEASVAVTNQLASYTPGEYLHYVLIDEGPGFDVALEPQTVDLRAGVR